MLLAYIIVYEYGWGFYDFASLALAFQFALLLVYRLGQTLPIRELASFVYIIQILIGSVLTYRLYPSMLVGGMVVKPEEYFGYCLPAVSLFILGLYGPRLKYTNYRIRDAFNKAAINKAEWNKMGIVLVVVGLVADQMANYLPSEGLNFVYALMYLFRFVGLFYLFLGRYKYRYIVLLVIFLPFAINGFQSGLFIELFVWIFLTFAVLQLIRPLKFRTNLIIFFAGMFMMIVIQSVKVDFRAATWKESNKSLSVMDRIEYFGSLLSSFDIGDTKTREVANMRFIVRINEGFIVSHILRTMPDRHPFADGKYFRDEMLGIFVPRFLFPDKAVVGSHEKFEQFAGWKLSNKVAMSVSILGDGYGNFGYWGGLIFCFMNGLLLNVLLHFCIKLALRYETSLLLWIPLIFTYSVRCGDEFYIITNHIFKSSIVVFVIFFILKNTGRLARLKKPIRALAS